VRYQTKARRQEKGIKEVRLKRKGGEPYLQMRRLFT
jgi:hypothetical protein